MPQRCELFPVPSPEALDARVAEDLAHEAAVHALVGSAREQPPPIDAATEAQLRGRFGSARHGR